MSDKFYAKPTIAPAISRPGESKEYVGTRNVTGLLPNIFQTTVNKKFLESTLEQLMTSGSLMAIGHFVGEKLAGSRNSDRYLDKDFRNTNLQFVPGAINANDDDEITNALTYEDLINALKFNEAQADQHGRIFNETGYTLDLPINYDMFTNHHRYFWVLNDLPICEIKPTSANAIVIDDITDNIYYRTQTLSDSKILELQNGMRIKFAPTIKDVFAQTVTGNTTFTISVGDATTIQVFLNNELLANSAYSITGTTLTFNTAPTVDDEVEVWLYYASGTNYSVGNIYIVEGVGSPSGVKLIEQFVQAFPVESYGKRTWINNTIYGEKLASKFDADDDSFDFKPFDISEFGLVVRDYLVEERWAQDQSAWARSNLWVHEDVVRAVCDFTETDERTVLVDTIRAVRPIIEFRANIEKFNFGKQHIAYVNHMFDTVDNPAVDIVGQVSFNLASHMITTNWQERGYNKGDMVRVAKGANVTYWDCIKTHTAAFDPTHYESQIYWRQVFSEELEDNDLILFRDSNTSYDNKIYRVGGVTAGTGITLTEVYNFDGSVGATQINVYDKVVVLVGYNSVFLDSIDTLIYSGSEWYWNGSDWIYGQQKDYASEEILFNLYDINLVSLRNSTVYPNSNFAGDFIFKFGRGNSRVDEALGFAPKYVDYGNNPGLEFDFGLGAVRYQFDNVNEDTSTQKLVTDASLAQDIPGFYFYKTLDTAEYHNGWKQIRNGQPVKLHQQFEITEPQGALVVDLGTTDINTDDKFVLSLFNNKLNMATTSTLNTITKLNPIAGTNPVLFMSKGRTYSIQTIFDASDIEIVNVDGTAASDVTRTSVDNNNFTFTISNLSVDRALRYRLVSDNTVTGIIYIDDNTNYTTVTVYRNNQLLTNYTISGQKLTTTFYEINDVIDVYWHTDSEVINTTGEFLVADVHTLNPQNDWLTTASYGDLQQHLREQTTSIPTFTGDYFGANNYKEIPHVHEFNGTIRKQPFSTEILAQSLMDTDTNVFNSIKFATQSYRRFVSAFLQKVRQLHNTSVSGVSVYELVDRALETLNLGKSSELEFANSNMALYRDYEEATYVFDNTMPLTFALPKSINTYNDTKNHIQAWLYDVDGSGTQRYRSLIKDIDYTLTNDKLTLLTTITYNSNSQAQINIRWYSISSVSFVPPSAAKLGLIKPHKPEVKSNLDLNCTGTFSDEVIILHDGSYFTKTSTDLYNRNAMGFNISDAAIWELETRIYNNLNSKLDTVIDYKEIMPNANRNTVYSWQNLTTALTPEFNKWRIRNNITSLQENGYYDPLNKFTWNYRSVYPFIGGYKGIYVFFFNTETPHTTPWEMFGYAKKPSWWDTYYSWTDVSKRTALITALKTGHYNNPAESVKRYNITYTYTAYDWDTDVLVTTGGNLNDPATANVVTTPTIGLSDAFVFGDYGPIESSWRQSSEYKTDLFVALARLRPLWVTNTYFNSVGRRVLDTQGLYDKQIIDDVSRELNSLKNYNISNTNYENSIIESIRIVNGGSGYVSSPTISIYSNFGAGANATTIIENGSVVSISITNPGREYQSKPLIVPSEGNAEFEAVLLNDAKKYFIGLNNIISEYAISNKTNISDIEVRFANLRFSPTFNVGGFVNPNNQTLVLESSQDKGRVTIPEENFTSILHISQPDEELFFGAVKLLKTITGVIVSGYDNDKQTFTYKMPAKNSKKSILTIDDERIEKYKSFEEYDSVKDYNTEIVGLQNLYDFIAGYGHKLNTVGWLPDWTNSAARAIEWASKAAVNDTYYVIPSTRQIEIRDRETGYFDNVSKKYDGIYNVIDRNGGQISSSKIIVVRDVLEQQDPVTVISIRETATEIYGVRLYNVKLEHVIVVDNKTDFDDVIYDPALGLRHKRIGWRGSRTKDWNGKLYSPGYIVTDNTIINNFDTTAREVDQYYGPGDTINNQQIVDAARFNIGYNKPEWSLLTDIDNDVVFNFTKGSLKYKGTKLAVDAFMRNIDLFGQNATVDLHEEWAIRTADYGDIRSRNTLEFQLTPNLITTNPQPVRFTDGEKNDVLTDLVIDIDTNSNLLVTGSAGNNFETRPAKTYTYTTISAEEIYASDFVTAGLPLTTETDYRVINRNDFAAFPEETKEAYSFEGEWQNIFQWDNKTSYKFNDRVIYEGRVWEMLDPDGSSGLDRPNDPITITGTISLPTVPSTGQTLIIDGTTVNISNSSVTTTFDVIQVTGTNDIATTAVVPHNSTIILGTSSTDAVTLQFTNVVNELVYQDIIIDGTVENPVINGSSTAQLIIDSTSIPFNDTTSSSQNITALTAFENAFITSFVTSISQINTIATARISAIESLRVAYINSVSQLSYNTFISNYFSNNAGLNINLLLTELSTATVDYDSQLEALISNDVAIINAILNRTYNAASVIAGTETVTVADISAAQTALNTGIYIDDIANWLLINTTIQFLTSTVVATSTTSVFDVYTLLDIVNQINSAGIPNVQASAVNDKLRITKTTVDTSTRFSLTINAATSNTSVGFPATTSVYNSTGVTVTSTPNLTINQVVNQINNANISGISARISQSNTSLLQVISNNNALFIGNGNANSVIGITQGVTLATTSITTISSTSALGDIVDSINLANINGVTASNSNNRLRIVSTNDTLIIGAGTANTTVGLNAQTYTATQTTVSNVFNAIVGSDGNQVFREMENDPNLFSIWVANDSDENSLSEGYAVYQTMDFDMYISRACAGINDADDAQITIARPTGLRQFHNLQENDYVLIRGSNTVPSIDGIHRVVKTDTDSNITFYIDKFIDKEGDAGNVYPIRNVRFKTYNELLSTFNTTINTIRKYKFAGYRQNNTRKPIYAFVDNNGSGKSAVYQWTGSWNDNVGHFADTGFGWKEVRTTIDQARNDLIDNIRIYDAERKSLITTIETYDPAKGILPGFVDKEIEFKTTADVAGYNFNTLTGNYDNPKAWKDDKVGLRWWDLTTSVFLDYEQGSIDYQQNNWGRLFDGASIDIYEWTRSTVLPEQWQQLVNNKTIINGVPASGEAYYNIIDGEKIYDWTEAEVYNHRTKTLNTQYFFWVKNKTNFSGLRNYNTKQLSVLIESPASFNIAWVAASGSSNLLLSNVINFLGENTVVQVNKKYDSDALDLEEWTLLSDGDVDSIVPEYFHIKIRDSLAGYDKSTIVYNYTEYSSLTTYNKDDVVIKENVYYICLKNNTTTDPATDTTMTNWKRIYDYEIIAETLHDDISVLASQSVPDLDLHKYNRYGHLKRPRQSLYRDLVEARQNFVESANDLLKDICIVNDIIGWETKFNESFVEGTVTYKTNKYWSFVDWIRRTYNNGALVYEYNTNIVPDYTVNSSIELESISIDIQEGATAYVRVSIGSDGQNRPEVYKFENNQWILQWKKNGTIALSEELWNESKFGNGFDAIGFDIGGFDNHTSNILARIFDSLRNNIFIGQYQVLYNKLWFKCLYQAVTQNTTDDFAFKTTNVKLQVNKPLLALPRYKETSMTVLEKYFNSIKPFHTKLRSSLESNTIGELVGFGITEESRNSVITMKYDDHSMADWANGDVILSGGTFTSTSENVDSITFTTLDNAIEYIYNGNSFIQPNYEGWGEELYPADFTENIRIRVQTNASGSTATIDTRTFQINILEQHDVEESIAIVQASTATTQSNITATDTNIPLIDASMLFVPAQGRRGVAWINNERITYGAIENNTLKYCNRGTYATSAVAHASGASVIDASIPQRVHMLEIFAHYGDGLRLAYNDSGVSLASAGITPEHAFIRNAGYGTL
jgi:hypothetical protein